MLNSVQYIVDTIDIQYSHFSIYTEGEYTHVHYSEGENMWVNPGSPSLPELVYYYIIPLQSVPVRVTHEILADTFITLHNKVFPVQQPVRLCEEHTAHSKFIVPDTCIYNKNAYFPESPLQIADVGYMDGAKIVKIRFFPVQYNPVKQNLHIILKTKIILHLKSSVYNSELNLPQVRNPYLQKIYTDYITYLVSNPQDITSFYYAPSLFVPGDTSYVEYAIITRENLVNAVKPLEEHLRKMGFVCKTFTVWSITHSIGAIGRDAAEKIKNFLRMKWQSYGLVFVLFVGDDDMVPFRYCHVKNNYDNEAYVIPCDLYFSDLTGNWDVDGDMRFGEPEDSGEVYPEVFVGRITVRDSCEIRNWLEKLQSYQMEPYTEGITSAYFEYLSEFSPADLFGCFPEFWAKTGRSELSAGDVIHDLNNGYGMVFQYGHGSPYSWMTKNDNGDDYIISTPSYGDPYHGLWELSNRYRYPVVYSISCDNAAFDKRLPLNTDTCFADGWLDAYSHKGAVTFLGNTRYGWWPGSKLLNRYFLAFLFDERTIEARVGIIESSSKIRMGLDNQLSRYICYSHNVFGDPSMSIWRHLPEKIDVKVYPERIPVKQVSEIFLSAYASERPLDSALVVFYKKNEIYKRYFTDEKGELKVLVEPKTIGDLYISVLKYEANKDFIPGRKDVQVYLPRAKGEITIKRALRQRNNDRENVIKVMIKTSSSIRELEFVVKKVHSRNLKLSVYNKEGRRIIENRFNLCKEIHLDLSDLKNGTYFILFENGNYKSIKKIIISN